MPPKACTVTFQDLNGTRHSVEVTAETLYEAAALALQAFRQAEFIDPNPGTASRLEVEVKAPVVRHSITVGQVMRWVGSGSSDPREGNRKARLAEMLGAK